MIITGNSLDVLKQMPSSSVDCCVTSPPYFNLRDYSTEGQIWDGDPKCEHQWEETKTTLHYGESSFQPDEKKLNKGLNPTNTDHQKMVGGKCIKCGAWKGSLGLEPTPDLYVKHLCDIFDEVKRVLKPEGSAWINLGDTYNSHSTGKGGVGGIESKRENKQDNVAGNNKKPNLPNKSLCLIPERFVLEMSNRGWVVRNEIIWWKRSCMPSSVKDRYTIDFEKLFFFTKQPRYYFKTQYEPTANSKTEKSYVCEKCGKEPEVDEEVMVEGDEIVEHEHCQWVKKEPNPKTKALDVEGSPMYRQGHHNDGLPHHGDTTRTKRCVWDVTTTRFKEAHFATYPPELIESPIDACCPEFICKKCGMPRKKIYEPINLVTKAEREAYKATKPKLGETFRDHNTCIKDELIEQYEPIGLTDCGCGAGWTSGVVLDPFSGASTTGVVAMKQNKRYIGLELNPEYVKIATNRLKQVEEEINAKTKQTE